MSSSDAKDEVVRVDFAFKRELAQKIEGDLANFCYQCGACVGDCPATRYSPTTDCRSTIAAEALHFRVRYGNGCYLLAMVTGKKNTMHRSGQATCRPTRNTP